MLQVKLQQYVNCDIPDVQAGFGKGRGTRDQIANILWITEKAREFQKNIYLCFIDYTKAFDCVGHNKVWKILKEMTIPDHLTCLLRNLYAGKKQQLEPYMEQQTGSRLGQEYVKAVYCYPAYLTYMQSESESEVSQSYPTLCDPWTAAHQAPLSMGFSRQEYWSGLPFPSPDMQSTS